MPSSVNPPPPPSRRERARATRNRILDAGHELFVQHGYAGTRMQDVAEKAGVAVQTVYFTFHTKPELLSACIDRAVLGEDEPLPPQMQPWYQQMMQAPTGDEMLRWFAQGNCTIAARVAGLDVVVASALHEPDALAVHRRHETLRREGYREVAGLLADRFGLRDGLTVDRATDIMLTMGSDHVYVDFISAHGWEHDEFAAWLAGALARLLLTD